MNRLIIVLLAGWLAASSGSAANTRASLLLSAGTVRPGDQITAGIRLQMDPGWHTYWKHGGDSGGPTKITWQLPAGLTAGEIAWPTPEKYTGDGLVTYVYHDEAILLVPLMVASNVPPGELELQAEVAWLECKELCIPGEQTVRATLRIGPTNTPSEAAPLLMEAAKKLPPDGNPVLQPRAQWTGPETGDTRLLQLEWQQTPEAATADFFPEAHDGFEVGTGAEYLGKNQLRLKLQKYDGAWPGLIRGVLIVNATNAYAITAVVEAAAANPQSLGLMLVYAFIGGLILNIMPCVLPVIALKILGFVGQAQESPARVRHLGLVYALGVLVSFLGLAALVIGVKSAGQAAGWGMQFSSPQFTIAFALLVTLVALNLFGVFEVTLGGGVMGAADQLASRHGASGAFFNGVLATVLATPCTAPFLSLALGFAFSQSAGIIILIFLTVGLGLASPYVVLSWFPAWLKFLPKPGVWMERFKVAMGFPMLATALWLASLVTERYGERAWWLGVFLVFVAMAAWILGTFIQRGTKRPGLAWLFLLGCLGLGYGWALEAQLQWRHPVDSAAVPGLTVKNAPQGYPWQKWSAAAVAQAQAEGRVVLVDFTAKWCITCNSIVKPALERAEVVMTLQQHNVAAFVADYTDYPPELTAEMKRYQRAAVPLVLVFPPKVEAAPEILPDPNPLLGAGTYAGVVKQALERAAAN